MVLRAVGKHGVCKQHDLVSAVGRYRVRAALRRGELVPLWAGVLVDADRATELTSLAAAALLAAGPEAAITGPTAANFYGCTSLPATPVHVIVPYEHWLRSRPGLVVHNGRCFEPDVEEIEGLRVLGLEAVLAQLLCTARPADALAVADEALSQVPEPLRADLRSRVHARVRRREDPRGTVRGASVLDLATGRAESPAESRLLWAVVEVGLPRPEMNWPVCDLEGVVIYRLDVAWPAFRVAVEYQGYAAHHGRDEADAARQLDLERRGWTVIPVWAADMRDQRQLIARVRGALTARGWR